MCLDLAICICSRGLIHSRTMDSLGESIIAMHINSKYFFSHNKSIPEAQNDVTEQALSEDPNKILYIEEDIKLFPETIQLMLEDLNTRNVDVVSARYNMEGGVPAYKLTNEGAVIYTGMGCFLVRASVFQKLEKPYFNNRFSYFFEDGVWKQNGLRQGLLGGQDIAFHVKLFNAGIKVILSDCWVKHLKIVEFGKSGVNDGCHKIIEI